MGANIFALLTGLFPYYETWEKIEVEKLIASGVKPQIDSRYRSRSYIEGRLVEIMEPCFEVDSEERISIFEVVAHLRETKRVYIERNGGQWPVDPQDLVRIPPDRVQPTLPEIDEDHDHPDTSEDDDSSDEDDGHDVGHLHQYHAHEGIDASPLEAHDGEEHGNNEHEHEHGPDGGEPSDRHIKEHHDGEEHGDILEEERGHPKHHSGEATPDVSSSKHRDDKVEEIVEEHSRHRSDEDSAVSTLNDHEGEHEEPEEDGDSDDDDEE